MTDTASTASTAPTVPTAPLVVFTNVFTIDGQEPSSNQYLNMFAIWYQFLRQFGGLEFTKSPVTVRKTTTGLNGLRESHIVVAPAKAVDEVHVTIDSASLAFLRSTTQGTDLLDGIHFHSYTPPATIKEGMLHRYNMASHFQWVWPGRSFLYLDTDIIVCRPLRTLYDMPSASNRLWYTTEERIQHFAGDLMSPNYLAGRLLLSPTEYGILLDKPGIGSGLFGWHHEEAQFGDVFGSIVKRAQADTVNNYYTIDQPYFNETVVQKMLRGINEVFHIKSDLVGINEPPSPDIPYTVIHYSGEPGDGIDHILKMEIAFNGVFRT